MFSSALLVTFVVDGEYDGLLTVTRKAPICAPRTVAFADNAPSVIVTCGVRTSTAAGFALTTDSVRPPGGAGLGPILIGSATDWPNGTFKLNGVLMRFCVTDTL